MLLIVFIKACLMGLAIAVPVGPIGLLCVRYTLKYHMRAGLCAGFGAACADAIYATFAGFGVVAVATLLESAALYIKLVAGGFLIFMGIKDLMKHVVSKEETLVLENASPVYIFTSTFFLTLTNPMTILMFLWIFSSLGALDAKHSETWTIVLGIFCGALLWWLILTSVVSYSKARLSTKFVSHLSQFSAFALIGLGIFSLLSIWLF